MARSKTPFIQVRIPYVQRGQGLQRLWEPVNIIPRDVNGALLVEFADGEQAWIDPSALKYRLQRMQHAR